ncbi:MAG: hypothetical protein AAF513_08750 [Pseudomonadota bacterium]
MLFHRLYVALVVIWVWAAQVHGHTLAHEQSHPTPTTLEEVEARLLEYRATGDDGIIRSIDEFFAGQVASTPEALLLRAWHAQAMHRFARAIEVLEPLLSSDHAHPWLLTANLQRVMGHHSRSHEACRRVAATRPLLGRACILLNASQQGDSVAVIELQKLEALLVMMQSQRGLGTEDQAWLASVLADGYWGNDDLEQALKWSSRAFMLNPTVVHEAAYAERLLEVHAPLAVLDLIDAEAQAPALVVLRLRALQQAGRLKHAQAMVARVDRQFRHDIEHEDYLHAREMVWFYLDILPRPEIAKRLAAQNWLLQKELEDRRLLNRVQALR